MSKAVCFTPDYGPENDSRCFECGAPVDDVYKSTTKYSGPIAEIFSSCFNCGAPDIVPIGICPGCRGLVFEFDTKFACFNETLGSCDFCVSKSHLESIDLWGSWRSEISNLLISPIECISCGDIHGTHEKTLRAELVYSEQNKWIVDISETAE